MGFVYRKAQVQIPQHVWCLQKGIWCNHTNQRVPAVKTPKDGDKLKAFSFFDTMLILHAYHIAELSFALRCLRIFISFSYITHFASSLTK